LRLLGRHRLVDLNLMKEPEFLALPVAKAIARIECGEWGLGELQSTEEIRVAMAAAFAQVEAAGFDGLLS